MERPEELRQTRQFDARTMGAMAAIAVFCCLAAGYWWWTGRAEQTVGSTAVIVPSTDPAGTETPTPTVAPAAVAESLVVDVRGAVRDRGIHRLPGGSRVIDAVRAAGGLRAGGQYGQENLARVLVDGEQLRIGGRMSAAPAPPAGSPAASAAPGGGGVGVLDLNTATQEQLETLNGVGPVTAAAIIAWRDENGRFTSVDDLLDVSGIGDKTLEGFRDSVRVG